MAQLSGSLHVEAIVPAGVLQNFDVAFDYGACRLTLAPPGSLAHDGTVVPFRLNPKTGFVTVDAAFAAARHPMVIDNGGSFSVLRSGVIADLVDTHPDWVASDTAIGEANLTGSTADAGAPVLKLLDAALGDVAFPNASVVVTGMGSFFIRLIQGFFWDFYSGKAGEPVDGWIGGNVLKEFRVTFDYRRRVSYWLRQRAADAHELDQVGITLARVPQGYAVAVIATKNGVVTVTGVEPSDMVIAVDGLVLHDATRGQIFAALHRLRGETRTLTLERDGRRFSVGARVTAF